MAKVLQKSARFRLNMRGETGRGKAKAIIVKRRSNIVAMYI